MKNGFEIYIQSSLTPEEIKEAEGFANNFITQTCADPKKRYFGAKGGGYTTGLWRGRFGIQLRDGKSTLTFRRISKNKRAFAIVRIDTLEVFNDKHLNKSHKDFRDLEPDGPISPGCHCPQHKGSLRVRFKNRPEMTLFAKVGESKG